MLPLSATDSPRWGSPAPADELSVPVGLDGNGLLEFFDLLLEKAGVVVTPGSGFGTCGEGYIRISAFNSRENVEKAMQKMAAAAEALKAAG